MRRRKPLVIATLAIVVLAAAVFRLSREGDLIHDRFGGGEYADGAFHVCAIGD